MDRRLEWMATAAFGLEGVVANELRHMGIDARAEMGGARFTAPSEQAFSANLWLRRSRKTESGINFSVYNAYARNNPIFMTIKMEPNEEKTKISIRHRSISLFNIIPSIGYFFKF